MNEQSAGRRNDSAGSELPQHQDPTRPRAGDHRPGVLVIEDNAALNRFICLCLEPLYRVTTAFDGAEGLEKIVASPPDLILSDLVMPVMDGVRVVEEVRSRPELDGIPIIILTATEDEELHLKLLRMGAQDYLMKPFPPEQLDARVANLIVVKRARDILQGELKGRVQDIEVLARQVALRQQELQQALLSVELAREQAERASRSKSQFLGMVSHEMRTPLMTLQLQTERLARSIGPVPDVARQMDLVTRIEISAQRLTDTVESLLSHAAIESGRLTVESRTFDPTAVVDSVIEELLPLAERKGLVLRRASAPADAVRTDPRLLRLIVLNLVANAVKFTSTGTIDASVDKKNGACVVLVQDSGPGIPPSDQGRVFEAFEQLEPVRGKHRPGVGLGLALVKEMATALGARIELQSEVGRGSTFTVVIPQ